MRECTGVKMFPTIFHHYLTLRSSSYYRGFESRLWNLRTKLFTLAYIFLHSFEKLCFCTSFYAPVHLLLSFGFLVFLYIDRLQPVFNPFALRQWPNPCKHLAFDQCQWYRTIVNRIPGIRNIVSRHPAMSFWYLEWTIRTNHKDRR